MALLCLPVHTRVITHNALTVKLSWLIYGKHRRLAEGGRAEGGVVSHRSKDFKLTLWFALKRDPYFVRIHEEI